MIILSQNKIMLINFDNISGIVIRKNTDENMWQLQCKANEENKRILGKYKTEERAKEVLNEIMENYKNWEYTKMGKLIIGKVICDAIYKMPEK